MKTPKGRFSLKNIVSILAIASFLVVAQGAAMSAFAAEDWETWPRKKEPAEETGAAAEAGEEAGKKVSGGISAGTIGWTVAIVAGVAVLAIAAGGGGGGGGSSTTPTHTP